MYPVAVCALAVFFEAVEAYLKGESSEHLTQLDYLDSPDATREASIVYSRIGSLVSAAAYLYEQKVRHKDLKPSNILLRRDQIHLSDLGTVTEFSLLSQSANTEKGTLIYFAPEVCYSPSSSRLTTIDCNV